jgi:hypothetical protein
MPGDVAEVAAAYGSRQIGIARRVAQTTDRLWIGVNPANIAGSWSVATVDAFAAVMAGQIAAAASADAFVADALDAQGLDSASLGRIQARSFAGVASDGRPLDTLLFEPAFTARSAIKAGASVGGALTAGRAALDMIVRTQVADAGRIAVGASIVARRTVTGYVRMLNPPSCSRCVILAGRFYRWNAGFSRHPRCDCRHIPASEDRAGDMRTDPKAYFAGLTREQQDKTFTAAGAKAVRDGADLNRVVNANRGVSTAAGGRAVTTEATTKAGRLPGQVRGARLLPEQIYLEAGEDRSEAVRLLRLHGYLMPN